MVKTETRNQPEMPASQEDQSQQNERPWLIFHIEDVSYALDSKVIQSIMQKPEEIVAMPEVPEYIRGMVNIRGSVVPILDLRGLYGIASLEKQYKDFKNVIDIRKKDHIHWLEQLEVSAETDAPFTLAKDAHDCAFGQWYYNFTADHHAVNFVLKKLEDPHMKLHQAAAEISDRSPERAEAAHRAHKQAVLKNAKEQLMPQILALLDEVKEVFHHQYQEKLIVLERDGLKIGVVVDDVSAIDHLTAVTGHEELTAMNRSGYISAVGRGKKSDELILMMNGDRLLDLLRDQQDNCAADR